MIDETFHSRIRSLNRDSGKYGYKPFTVFYTEVMSNRAKAYSIERFLQTELKHLQIDKFKPYLFAGQGEIYYREEIENAFYLLDYVKSFLKN